MPNTKRILVYPGWVRDQNSGMPYFVGFVQLLQLYKISIKDYAIINMDNCRLPNFAYREGDILLEPLPHENYDQVRETYFPASAEGTTIL